ncbi:LppP/LprE family lipoprotein [Prescottella subtropica]|uniref:LppP/LprE family lipoprotein n=1 Tax=Prescottella subtropica TaxID=2545757 RepID=UPI001386F10B|nr:LppP/LprE family lipoprotein [Prescottella subtropica]
MAITSGRQPYLTAVTDDDQRRTAVVDIDPEILIAPAEPSELANTIAFYDLDGRPGAEIVVPVGTRGATSVFQVFALRDDELRLVSPPGDTLNITLGMGFWTFPGDRILARAMCRDGGLTLGSTEMPTPQLGREIDFTSRLDGPKIGEASEWIVAGQARTVDPAAITDMSVGQTHFKCDDVRVESLLGSNAPLTPSTQGCDDSADMSTVVEAAIASLPEPPVGSWQTDTVGSEELRTCKRLDYFTITTDMPTNSSPVAVLLFRDGVFVGPASSCFAPIETVQSDGSDAVSVVYRYPEAGESNAASSGRAKFTYTWQDGEVVKTGTAPDRLTQLLNCTP